MSNLLVQPGQWTSFSSAAVESFLASMAILLGLTEKRKKFLQEVYKNIHGFYTPDNFYHESMKIVSKWPPNMQLQNCMKECTNLQKKQLKIWYTELLTMEPMENTNPFLQLMLPPISNTINTF